MKYIIIAKYQHVHSDNFDFWEECAEVYDDYNSAKSSFEAWVNNKNVSGFGDVTVSLYGGELLEESVSEVKTT